MVQFLMKLLLI